MFAIEQSKGAVTMADGTSRLRILFVTESIVRVTLTRGKPFSTRPSRIATSRSRFEDFRVDEDHQSVEISTPTLRLRVSRATGAIRYMDASGNLLLAEPERGGKTLSPKKVFRSVAKQSMDVAAGQSIDGARAAATDFDLVFDRDGFEARLEFEFQPHEAVFGLGSHEEGYGNLRGKSRELYQQNMKIVVPVFTSTRGYAVLLDCGSLMTFNDGPNGAHWWADVVDELDFYFVGGGSFDAVAANLHAITGRTPMLPKWAFGYVQSKERYVNGKELVEIVRQYRKRKIPIDVIVLDWKSWPNGAGWGQKSFDPVRFPDPGAMCDELHSLGARLMISIWPIMTGGCPDQLELLEQGLMLGNQSTYDAFQSRARELYWSQAERGLFSKGVDAWWCDCTEPFEADWSGAIKPESQERLELNTGAAKKYLDHAQINTYSLEHSRGIYEGQRRTSSQKRVVNLTRSGYAGQHRYATICWNGDITATWETLRRCIPEGVNFCATGEPFWTVDIGGFFVNNDPQYWFWHGDYPEGCRGLTDVNALDPDPNDTGSRDKGFHELYTRWLQYAAFLPMFRSHGTDVAREIWRFGEEGSPFYDTIAKFIRLRYELMLYIYSLAAQVTMTGKPMVRAVALEFPSDMATHDLTDQYLFGPAILVCPVTHPMYFGPNSQPLDTKPKTRSVYLPARILWYDFWTNKAHEGGKTIEAAAPLESMPLFVRAGSILPMTEPMQFVDEKPGAPYEIRVYCGTDGAFTIYEDAGDGYDYENGAYSLINLEWNESRKQLRISARVGRFEGMASTRQFHLIFVRNETLEKRSSQYEGREVLVQL